MTLVNHSIYFSLSFLSATFCGFKCTDLIHVLPALSLDNLHFHVIIKGILKNVDS